MTDENQDHAADAEPPSLEELEAGIEEQRKLAAAVGKLGPAGAALAAEIEKGIALLERLVRVNREAERRVLDAGGNPHHKPGHA